MTSQHIINYNNSHVDERWSELFGLVEEKLTGNQDIPDECSPDVKRLIKVVRFLNDQIKTHDPELAPSNHMANSGITNQIDECIRFINNFDSYKDCSYINSANSCMDEVIKILTRHVIFLDNDALTSYIGQMKKEVGSIQEKRDSLFLEIEKDEVNAKGLLKKLREFESECFGYVDFDGDHIDGLEQRLENLLGSLKEFQKQQKAECLELNQHAKTLLLNATNAGLAGAYGSMKVSFKWKIRIAGGIFFTAIFCMIGLFIAPFFDSSIDFNDWDNILKIMVTRAPIYAALMWIALYASKRRSEADRLQQEYAHKEAMAKSFESYKEQAEVMQEEDGTYPLLAQLLRETIDTIAYNPSVTLEKKHGDATLAEQVAEAVAKALAKANK